ncbi:MAG: type II/IV secretion system ATPase subunit [Methanomicrobium sp.]|nr:type II/IV secretion system ATPase subunit [Methanomicrobium sp.]
MSDIILASEREKKPELKPDSKKDTESESCTRISEPKDKSDNSDFEYDFEFESAEPLDESLIKTSIESENLREYQKKPVSDTNNKKTNELFKSANDLRSKLFSGKEKDDNELKNKKTNRLKKAVSYKNFILKSGNKRELSDISDTKKKDIENDTSNIKKSALKNYLESISEITSVLNPKNQAVYPELKPHIFDYPPVPDIKDFKGETDDEILDRYWLKPPHSYAVIINDKDKNRKYLVFEPKISEKEHLILEETDAQLRSAILYDRNLKKEELKFDSEMILRIIKNLDPEITPNRTGIICYYLERNFQGYGKLDPLMHDEGIEDITCNGPDIPVFIFHRKYSNLPVNILFDANELNKFVLKIAQKADKQLSLTAPLVDAALPEGARAQITYTDVVSSKGSSFTIRKFKADPMTPVDLIDYGTYDAEILAFIWLCVENRKSAIVVGGTASGKTSMMNAFSLFIPQFAKIVSIEDTREIQMPHKNWLPMKTRESASESGKGNVDMFSLLKTALRQRPEYIIVGEVRGAEAQTLFQAMNTGHTTYSTLHAGGVEQAINRLTTNPINVPVAMFGALDLMIIQQLQYIGGRMVRRCITIDEVVAEKDQITYNVLYKWNPAKDNFRKVAKESRIINEIAYSHGWSLDETLRQVEIRKEILEGLLRHNIRSSDEITKVFDEFSKSGRYEFAE